MHKLLKAVFFFDERPECDLSFMKIAGQKNPYATVLRALHGFSVLSFFPFFYFLSFFFLIFAVNHPTFYSGTLHFFWQWGYTPAHLRQQLSFF